MELNQKIKTAESLWKIGSETAREKARIIFTESFLQDPTLIFSHIDLEKPNQEQISSYRERILFRLNNWYKPDSDPIIPLAQISNKMFVKDFVSKIFPTGVPETYYYGDDIQNFDFSHLFGKSIVIKPDNLANSDGVIILKNNVDLMTGNVVLDHQIHDYINYVINSHKQYQYRYFKIKKTKIIVEEHIEKTESGKFKFEKAPNVKIFCGGGLAWIIRFGGTRNEFSYFYRNFDKIQYAPISICEIYSKCKPYPYDILKCFSLDELNNTIKFAERIQREIGIFARIDCYISDRGPVLGEITTCDANGTTPSPQIDRVFAQLMEIFPDDPLKTSLNYSF